MERVNDAPAAGGCNKPGCFPYCDCGSVDDYVPATHPGGGRGAPDGQQQAEPCEDMAEQLERAEIHMMFGDAQEPATPSEDGREVPEVVEFHWPEYHAEGMGCGLEDRGIRDRYEAMQHGWDCALDRCAEAIPDEPLMTVAQHSRIVAGLVARNEWLEQVAVEAAETERHAVKVADALRSAQPARQVGGDDVRVNLDSLWADAAYLCARLEQGSMSSGDVVKVIRDRIDAAKAALAPAAVDQWEPSDHEYDRSIHHNPDAKAWADLFVATFPGLSDKHDLMLGWFANAMMAMHDWLKSQEAAATAVVMPERRAEDYPSPRTRDAYNAALDEVSRLNRRAIPEGLLERALYHLELSYGDMPTIRELRALLGKEPT